jgi:sulfite exporter TauE/SafE
VGIGTSLFLIAVGAILDFAVDVQTNGFNINTVGVILMIVGAIGLVLSLLFWGSWGGFHTGARAVDGPAVRHRTVDEEVI